MFRQPLSSTYGNPDFNLFLSRFSQILVHDVELSDVAEDLGSADLSSLRSLLAASEAADHTRVDDEDYAQSDTGTDEIRVDFSCEYSIGAQHNPNIEPEVSSATNHYVGRQNSPQ